MHAPGAPASASLCVHTLQCTRCPVRSQRLHEQENTHHATRRAGHQTPCALRTTPGHQLPGAPSAAKKLLSPPPPPRALSPPLQLLHQLLLRSQQGPSLSASDRRVRGPARQIATAMARLPQVVRLLRLAPTPLRQPAAGTHSCPRCCGHAAQTHTATAPSIEAPCSCCHLISPSATTTPLMRLSLGSMQLVG